MTEKRRKILMKFFIFLFCAAAVVFGKSLYEYHKGDQIYESAMEYVSDEESAPSTEQNIEEEKKEEEKKPQVASISNVVRSYANIDFSGLKKINPDVIGWIQILGTQVDYPLLDADDNQYYLHHTYDKRRSAYGSIFLEPRNSSDFSQNHLVVYGHNMVNRSMFGSLLHYKKQAYADSHNTITVCMPGRNLTYLVFSAYTAHVNSPTYKISFSSVESFNEMIAHMKENSMIYSNITPKPGDQILTLSTCTPAGAKDYRFVVNAVLISGNKPVGESQQEKPVNESSQESNTSIIDKEVKEQNTVIELPVDVQTVTDNNNSIEENEIIAEHEDTIEPTVESIEESSLEEN